MIIGITGSRHFTDYPYFKSKLDKFDIKSIVSGGSSGADTLAELYATEKGLDLVIYRAQWKVNGIYVPSAGPKRNAYIARDCDILLAFPSEDSIGTWDTVNKARKLGKKVYIYQYQKENKFKLDDNGYVAIKF